MNVRHWSKQSHRLFGQWQEALALIEAACSPGHKPNYFVLYSFVASFGEATKLLGDWEYRMSTEMHVLFRSKLPNKKALSAAMTELGFPFTIAAGSLERQDGFMPMRLRRQQTGVEFDVFNDRAAVEELAGKDIDPSIERSANFRWGGDEHEMLAGVCAAAALAKLVRGIVLDESDGQLLSPDQAIALARDYLQQMLKPESGPRPKVLSLKHCLKPLLQQRQDLVLVNRLLLIRPVRHIMRGALFDKIKGNRPIRVWRFMCPLFDVREHTIPRASLSLWEPHFEPLLMDVLANEVFDSVGQITSIDDFIAGSSDLHWGKITRALALLLSGARERAAAYVDELESHDPNNSHFKPWYAKLREYGARDVEDLCAEFRAIEEKSVKAEKLEGFWEPSPFPIELPAERKFQSDEPIFVPQPWIARPHWLLADIPERPGEVQFAKDWRERGDKHALIVPISREQAEDRHRNGESYVLSARLKDGLLVLLRWIGDDRNNPDRIEHDFVDSGWYILGLYGQQFFAQTISFMHTNVGGMTLLKGVRVERFPDRTLVWNWSLYRDKFDQLNESISDLRGDHADHARRVTDEETEKLKFPTPKFGEFEGPVRLMRDQLRHKGYGEIT